MCSTASSGDTSLIDRALGDPPLADGCTTAPDRRVGVTRGRPGDALLSDTVQVELSTSGEGGEQRRRAT